MKKFPWLETALAIAVIGLVFQLCVADPIGTIRSGVARLISLVDVRRWSRLTWFLANLLFVAILLAIRFWPRRRTRLN